MNKLSHDVLRKIDGCAASAGAPDNNDFVLDCTAQARALQYVREVLSLLERSGITR